MMKQVKLGLVSPCLMLSVACSTAPKIQLQQLYPMLTPCLKPIFVIDINQDLINALEQTELARSLCASQVDALIKIQQDQQ
ncbi:Rz1-like lysis system protein LysC [Acinetobacter guillouiae]|uniref:Rz1-like lysis system protein LysC n=1 Tax=Acinetobacter guillouiae TaxID=106649 RepID=UPI0027E4782C|nr:Rz1-like lysis system protein LysC [Acinetobacter guillouiae]